MYEHTIFITNAHSIYGPELITQLLKKEYRIVFTYDESVLDCSSLLSNFKEEISAGIITTIKTASPHNASCLEKYAQKNTGIDSLICLPVPIHNSSIFQTDRSQINSAYTAIYKDPLQCSRLAASDMEKRQVKGSILFITDMDGIRAQKMDFLSGSLRAALHRTTESLALQLAPFGIRVNCILPGVIEDTSAKTNWSKLSRRLPMGRPGTIEEIVQTIIWLSSDYASYITGMSVKCDGGNSLAGMPEIEMFYGWDSEFNG